MEFDLQYLADNGIIDLSSASELYEMEKRKEILQKHPYKIWQGKNGKWYTYLDERGKKRLKKRTSQKAVEDCIYKAWKEEAFGETIRDVFTEWNDRRLEMKKIAPSTHLRFKYEFNKFYSEFGNRKIRFTQESEFEDFLERTIAEYDLTAKRFANLKTMTRGFLKRARKRGIINWKVDYLISDLDVSDRDFRQIIKEDWQEVYDEDETRIMMDYLQNNIDEKNIGILLMFITGLRIGEVVALKKKDISEKTLFVCKTETMWKQDGKWIYTVKDYPKTPAGVRTVVVPESYEWVLKKIKLLNPFNEWAFVNKGERMKACQMKKRLEVICKTLGIRLRSAHKIRKTYVSILLDEHVDARFVLEQVGHADISTSERNYHRNRKTIARKQEILGSIEELNYLGNKGNAKNAVFKPKTGIQ